MPNQTVIV